MCVLRSRCVWRRLLRQPAGVFLREQRPGGRGGQGGCVHPARDDGGLAVLVSGCSSGGKKKITAHTPHRFDMIMLSRCSFETKVSVMETSSRVEVVAQEDKTQLLKTAFLLFCRCVTNQHLSNRCLLVSEVTSSMCWEDFIPRNETFLQESHVRFRVFAVNQL